MTKIKNTENMKLILIAGAEGTGHHALRAIFTDFYKLPEVDWWRYNRDDVLVSEKGIKPYIKKISGKLKPDRGTYEDTWIIDEEIFRQRIINGRKNGIKIIVNDNSFPFLRVRNPLRRPDYLKMISIARSEGVEPFIITIYRDPVFTTWSGFRRGFSNNLMYQAQTVENSFIIINNMLNMFNNNGTEYFTLRYEKLIDNPQKIVELLCDYLDLDNNVKKNIISNSDKLYKPKGPSCIPDKELEILTSFFTHDRCSQWHRLFDSEK